MRVSAADINEHDLSPNTFDVSRGALESLLEKNHLLHQLQEIRTELGGRVLLTTIKGTESALLLIAKRMVIGVVFVA